MIYLLDGTETHQMQLKKRQLLSQSDLLAENILSLDASSSSFDFKRALSSCYTVSLFSEKRVVILDSPFFLKSSKGGSTKKEKSKKGNDIADLLADYCENPAPDTDLILYCFEYDADKRKKEYKVLEKYFNKTVTHLHYGQLSPYELERHIDILLQKNQIRLTREARNELTQRISGSTTQFYQAMDKILLYDEKQLDKIDIEHLVSVNPNVNVWKFTDAFLRGNATDLMRSYNELTQIERLTPLRILPLLSYRIKTVFHAVRMDEMNMSLDRMRNITGKNQIDKDLSSARRMSSKILLGMLDEMATLEQNIKKGLIVEKEGFEQFLLRRIEKCNH